MPPIVSDSYKEKRKKEILESAMACFAKKGFQPSTIDDIVEHSGISKGAIYNYFKSKDEIYLELMKTSTEESYEELKERLATYPNAVDKMNFMFDLYLNNEVNQESTGRLVVHDEFKLHAFRNQELIEKLNVRRHEYFIKMFCSIIEEGQKAGEFKTELNPEIFADMFWSMIDGIMLQTIYPGFPYKQVLNEFKQMFLERIIL
ncbi:TetR/AcrR family transcriptional regulator [Bacillus sp. JJ1764]|uniref:TetR/AcrR family transcriptional regulator n=1 Tax=Bacillus sp. JJ1764 TaxID=3122964 RepID=UPI002FFFEB71